MVTKSFPALYQRSNTGAIQEWNISSTGNVITTVFGQRGGKMQTLEDLVKEGKNAGRANATTPEEQAAKEAEAEWRKKQKMGYVTDLAKAEAGEVDETFVQGGVAPMLAPNKSYPKDDELQKRIEFPCYAQPKLDGIRATSFSASVQDGKATLWSRTRKPIRAVPHIVEALEVAFPTGTVRLDGELYNHEYRNTFEDLVSIVRQDEPDADGLYKVMEYHVYDVIEQDVLEVPTTMATPFKDRLLALMQLKLTGPLVRVQTAVVASMEELVAFYESCLTREYEGAMARNMHAPYESDKRSKHLQKMKQFEDHEFKVLGINEGRGKDAGTAVTAAIQLPCLCHGLGNKDRTGLATVKAKRGFRRQLLENPGQWLGKALTVTMKRWSADGMPYIPNAKTVRDYE